MRVSIPTEVIRLLIFNLGEQMSKDPLHFSYDQLSVKVGERGVILSSAFLDKQLAWENLSDIKEHFKIKFELFNEMDKEEDPKELRILDKKVTDNEFIIQELFNFPRNANFHRFWDVPKCECPKMDNEDSWGTKYCIISEKCKIHGRINE